MAKLNYDREYIVQSFSDDNNYTRNAFAEESHMDIFQGLPKQAIVTADGTDITEKVETALQWLTEHSF